MYRPAGFSDDEDSEEEFDISSSRLIDRKHEAPDQKTTPVSYDWNYGNKTRGDPGTVSVDLRLAVEAGDVSEVERLVTEQKADINRPLCVPGGWATAVLAASLGHDKLLAWLLKRGAKTSTGRGQVKGFFLFYKSSF